MRKPEPPADPKGTGMARLFIARDGYKILTADYSQIELRHPGRVFPGPGIPGGFSKRRGPSRQNSSSDVWNHFGNQRTKKRGQDHKFWPLLRNGTHRPGRPPQHTPNRSRKFIELYFKEYPRVRQCLDKLGMTAVNKLYAETLSGRKRYFQTPRILPGKEVPLERKGKNTPIQGPAGHHQAGHSIPLRGLKALRCQDHQYGP